MGPLVGGSLTKKQIPGFEKYTYLAPCLLAAGFGLLVTFLVALVLNETNPKWTKPLPELPRDISGLTTTRRAFTTTTIRRGRPGYEQSRRFLLEEGILNNGSNSPGRQSGLEEIDYGGGVGSSDIQPKRPHPTSSQSLSPTIHPLERQQLSLSICTCPHPSPTTSTPPLPPTKTILSPATQLFLILGIYSLLVLTSILGSEFVMLYTQSPRAHGGLDFSARTLGQVLTMRGILKLSFNLFGYPFMVRRLGLVHCLRLGIAVIGTISILGMGWFVPWSVERERDIEMALATTTTSHSHFNNSNTSEAMMMGDQTPIGMSVVLLCMSMISIGDVLGYISVLVLVSYFILVSEFFFFFCVEFCLFRHVDVCIEFLSSWA